MTLLSLRASLQSQGVALDEGLRGLMAWSSHGSLRQWLAQLQTIWTPTSDLAKAVWRAGFSYDPVQDIIYSRKDAWQHDLGYCYAYDKYALLSSFVIDCEPIFFKHDDKEWMIELWKGQYGLETGCEVGLYNRSANDDSLQMTALDETVGQRVDDNGKKDPLHSKFYKCVNDADYLNMAFRLLRNGLEVFARGPERHWWLTGFMWGVLSRPEDLLMEVSITFASDQMQNAFVASLRDLGYTNIQVAGPKVVFVFDTPRTYQPRLGWGVLQDTAQATNQGIVDAYRALGLVSNDPNAALDDVGGKVEALASSFLEKERDVIASSLPSLLENVADEVSNRVRDFFGV